MEAAFTVPVFCAFTATWAALPDLGAYVFRYRAAKWATYSPAAYLQRELHRPGSTLSLAWLINSSSIFSGTASFMVSPLPSASDGTRTVNCGKSSRNISAV